MKDQQKDSSKLIVGSGETIRLYSDKFAPFDDTGFDHEGRMIVKKEDLPDLKVGYFFVSTNKKQAVYGKITQIDGTAVYFECRVKDHEAH